MTTQQLRKQFNYLRNSRALTAHIDDLKALLDGRCPYCWCALYEDEEIVYEYPAWVLEDNPHLPKRFINRTWNYHVDHLTPLSRGGTNDLNNLTISCAGCNIAKGLRLLSEFPYPILWKRIPLTICHDLFILKA